MTMTMTTMKEKTKKKTIRKEGVFGCSWKIMIRREKNKIKEKEEEKITMGEIPSQFTSNFIPLHITPSIQFLFFIYFVVVVIVVDHTIGKRN